MQVVRSCAFAIALVAVCVAYVPDRSQLGSPALLGDSLSYAAMIERSHEVESPFRFRVVVPLLARALPTDAARALAWITWTSLAASYALVLESARRLRLGRRAASFGLMMATFSASHLYNYHNPYLTDAPGLLVVSSCLFALVTSRYWLFALASAVGVGVREALLLVAPAWGSTGQRGRAAIALLLPALIYGALYAVIGMDPALNKGPFVFPARPLPALLVAALGAWQILWLLAGLGMESLRIARRELFALTLLLVIGALVTSLLASDTTRMFQPLFPLIALGVASFAERSLRCAAGATWLMLVAWVGSSWVWQPVRFASLEPDSDVERFAQAIALIVTWSAGAALLILVCRPDARRRRTKSEALQP